MILSYVFSEGRMRPVTSHGAEFPQAAIWLDLLDPTQEEVGAIEHHLGIDVPTPEEMREIEVSSRLYSEDGADFMTIVLPHGRQSTGVAHFAPVVFILSGATLVTLRYSEPKSFELYAAKLCREPLSHDLPLPQRPPAKAARAAPETMPRPDIVPDVVPDVVTAGESAGGAAPEAHAEPGDPTGSEAPNAKPRRGPKPPRAEVIFLGLLEAVVDRVADLLEGTATDLDHTARDIFQSSEQRAPIASATYKDMLRQIGRCADLASRTREALATFDRMLPFAQLAFDRRKAPKELRTRIKAMSRDVQSLNDFAAFLNNKTSFLLDTSVGMISIEQNAIIKIFSVAAVGFMPPTLIASIYGMNFHDMPELDWSLGYPLALAGMIISAVLPLAFFRYKKWL
ncbi:magnesium transporter CorA family protein [Aureimonas frigidaquae]|uniref:magnesium transporter CorA family protein n=1 Tax=Aureimonas frigidaquae TaxID=424757 RepID=UPI00078219C6|nr:magnesium transporter CorA family protein [Aureimonas frigidaquae]